MIIKDEAYIFTYTYYRELFITFGGERRYTVRGPKIMQGKGGLSGWSKNYGSKRGLIRSAGINSTLVLMDYIKELWKGTKINKDLNDI